MRTLAEDTQGVHASKRHRQDRERLDNKIAQNCQLNNRHRLTFQCDLCAVSARLPWIHHVI